MQQKLFSFLKENLAAQVLASLLFLLLGFSVVRAVTTLSTNIVTDGTLAVTGATTLSADLYSTDGALFNISSTTAFLIQNGSGTSRFAFDTTGTGSGLAVTGTTTVTTGGEGSRGIVVSAAASQRNNLFQLNNSSGTFLSGFTGAGGLLMNVSSTTGLVIQDGSGTNKYEFDTTATGSGLVLTATTSITTAGEGSRAVLVTASASQRQNLFQLNNSSGTFLSGFTGAGGLLMNISSTTALVLQNGSGTNRFVFDTTSTGSGFVLTATTSITTNGEGSRGILVTAAASQRQNLFQLNNSSNVFLSGFTGAGGLLMNISSTTAFVIQNGSGTTQFVVDSATGNATTTGNFNFNSRNPFVLWNPTTVGDKISISSTTTLASLDMGGTWVTKGPQTQNGSPDVAEYIMTRALTGDELGSKNSAKNRRLPEAYDVVAVDRLNKETAVLAVKPYDKAIMGIITDGTSGFMGLANISDKPGARPLALAGRVPVKVTSENGLVQAGDVLTVSATKPGYAMRATTAGYIIGKALESIGDGDDTVLVFISNTYYPGE